MTDTKMQELTISIKYNGAMTVVAMEESLHIVNEAFAEFAKENQLVLSESNEFSPQVASVSTGSLIIDVVSISCALLPILYDIIKNRFASYGKHTVQVCKTSEKKRWVDKDCYALSKAVLEEYSIKNATTPVGDFIDTLSLSKPYGKKSIRAKVQNTKHLINEGKIQTSLSLSPLKHCSKAHRREFEKTRKSLKI